MAEPQLGGRQFAKLRDLRDWEDPALVRGEIVPERDPATHVERKVWEFGMLARFLEETGRTTGSATLVQGPGE